MEVQIACEQQSFPIGLEKRLQLREQKYLNYLKRDELDSLGFYLLTGVDPDSGDKAIYIGRSRKCIKSLEGHASKDFWNSVTVFVSKDENLTKSHIRYLEGILIKLATN